MATGYVKTNMFPNQTYPLYTVECGCCNEEVFLSSPAFHQAIREPQKIGWRQTEAFGRTCPECAVDMELSQTDGEDCVA